MGWKIGKVKIWGCELEDRPGSVSEKLAKLAEVKADLKFVFARRKPDQPGKGLLFVAPILGKKQEEAACNAGFSETQDLVGVSMEGTNKAGLGHKFTQAIAQAQINLRGIVATVIGNKFVAYFAFDNSQDAEKGIKELRKLK